MTHARIHHLTAGILAVAITIVLTASTAISATARTFSFNSAGSMTQQPLVAEWACIYQRVERPRRRPVRTPTLSALRVVWRLVLLPRPTGSHQKSGLKEPGQPRISP